MVGAGLAPSLAAGGFGIGTDPGRDDGSSSGAGLAFAFWGGDAWLFSDSAADDGSVVTRLDLDGDGGGGSSLALAATPARFLGAGVSICAPFVPTG